MKKYSIPPPPPGPPPGPPPTPSPLALVPANRVRDHIIEVVVKKYPEGVALKFAKHFREFKPRSLDEFKTIILSTPVGKMVFGTTAKTNLEFVYTLKEWYHPPPDEYQKTRWWDPRVAYTGYNQSRKSSSKVLAILSKKDKQQTTS